MMQKKFNVYTSIGLIAISLCSINASAQGKKSYNPKSNTSKVKSESAVSTINSTLANPDSTITKKSAKDQRHARFSKLSEDEAPDTNSDVGSRDYLQKSSHSTRLLRDLDDSTMSPTHKAIHSSMSKKSAGEKNAKMDSRSHRLSQMQKRRLESMARQKGKGAQSSSHHGYHRLDSQTANKADDKSFKGEFR